MQRVMMSATALAIGIAGGQAGAMGPCHDRTLTGATHSNGGGWVHDTAEVADSAYVRRDSYVCDKARVYGNAALRNAHISGSTHIYGNATVRSVSIGGSGSSGGVRRYNSPHVYGNARITFAAAITGGRIYGNAKVGEGARVDGGLVYGNAKVFGGNTLVDGGEVFGTAVVRGDAKILSGGKVNCGRWIGITVTTDRTGECGRNGKAKILTLPALPGINPGNTETAE